MILVKGQGHIRLKSVLGLAVQTPLLFLMESVFILKLKRNATLSKIAVLSFSSKNSVSDNEITKYRYLTCTQHQNQTTVTNSWRAATRNVRQPPMFKVTKFKKCAYFAKKTFKANIGF